MLTIENIESLAGKFIGQWKIHNISIGNNIYYIKVLGPGASFDMFNLVIDRQRTEHGVYHVSCFETGNEQYIPIEVIRDRDEFLRYLIDELI